MQTLNTNDKVISHTAQKLAAILLQRCNISYCSVMLQRYCKELFAILLQQCCSNVLKIL